MSGRSTCASLAAEAATTQLETIDVRLQRSEEAHGAGTLGVSEFMCATQAPGLGTAHAVGLGAAPAAAPAAAAPAAPAAPPPTTGTRTRTIWCHSPCFR